jgi:aldehyde:ferredoxin oxidoreductase
MKLLRVDMSQSHVRYEPVPPVYERLGGRGLIARLLLEDSATNCEPLGPLVDHHPRPAWGCGVTAGAFICGR